MPDRWATIDRIFDEAVEHPATERRDFVGRASGGDDEVAGEVLALLRSHEEAQLILGDSAVAYAEPLFEAVAAEWAETVETERRVGPYRLLREIGEGGVGSVFLARTGDELQREVALKLVKRGMDSSEGLLRFRYERQILAGLEHPNIARLYDGGVAQEGLPYLVMEYVDGRPITTYCQDERLGLEARLALFGTVCRAVQFAHQHLVVHRGLKPSNILVTAGGTPKLLDCGIARLLGTDAPLLTPEYAAPEQIQGGAITTATDVYALGALLHELLAGSPHIGLEGKDAPEAEQALRRLPGDLGSIVLRALQQDPERRYGSVQELLDDVDRHLAAVPVRARPPALGYPLRSYVRRHRVGVATATAVIALIAGASMFYHPRLGRDQVRASADTALAATELVADRDTLDVFGLLERGTRPFSPAEVSGPEALATLQGRLGRLYLDLGDYPRAIPLLDSAVVLRRAVYGSVHDEVARALREAAEARRLNGDYPGSDSLYRQALAIQRQRLGVRDPEVGVTLNRLADVLARSGRPDSAEPLYGEALDILGASPGDERSEIAIGEFGLGLVKRSQGRVDQAERMFRDVLRLRRELADEPTGVAARLDDLGLLYLETGRYDSAEATLRESLALRRTRFGAEQREVARGLTNLALITLLGRKDYPAADSLWHQALGLWEEMYGRNHREVGTALANLGQLELERGNPDSALHLFATGRKVMRVVSGEESADVARMYRFVGLALYLRGDLVGAEPEMERAVELRRAVHGSSHLGLAGAELSLADVLRDRGKFERADSLYAHALAMWRKLMGDDDGIAAGLNGWGRLRLLQGRTAEADSMLREALEIAREHHPDSDERVAQAQADLGAVLLAQGRADEGEALLVNAYPHLSPYEQPRARTILAALHRQPNRPEGAAPQVPDSSGP